MSGERIGKQRETLAPSSSASPSRSAALLTLVRPEERVATALATLTVLLVMTGHAFMETARDALFLAHVPATNLPWVYLVLALLAILVSHALEKLGGRETVWRGLVLTQLFAAAGTLVFVMRVPGATYWTFHALYVWGGLASTVVLVRFWMLLSERLTSIQAKRLFPLIAAGSVAGTLLGFAIAGIAGRSIGGDGLVLLSSLSFFASAAVALTLRHAFCGLDPAAEIAPPSRALPSQRSIEQAHKMAGLSGFRIILKDRYVRRMTLVMLAASVTATLCDYLFKTVVSYNVPTRDLSAFFASTYFVFNLLSVTVLLVVMPFVRWIGVPKALAAEPILLVVGGALWVLFGGLPAVLYLRGVDGALRWSLQKTATELLYVPMSARLRTTVKALSDVLGHRGGQALASVLILALIASRAPDWSIGLAVAAVALIWMRAAVSLQQPYLELFRKTLRSEFAETRLDFPELDLASLETLIAALNSGDDQEVIGAIEFLSDAGRVRLIPALILYHPSPAVVIRALELFEVGGREDFLPITRRLLAHGDPAVRAAVLRARASARPDRQSLEQARQSGSPPVAATALVGLAAQGWLDEDAAIAELRRLLEADEAVGYYLGLAAAVQPVPALMPLLVRSLDAAEVETRRATVRALGALDDASSIPVLIERLADRDIREEVRETLLTKGAPAFEALRHALADLDLPEAARLHVPRTISGFGHQPAADLLLHQLSSEPHGRQRYKILRALGRLMTEHPELQVDGDLLDQVIERYIARLFEMLHWCVVLDQGAAQQPARRTTGHELLLDLIRAKFGLALERLFRLIGLRYRSENVAQIYRGVTSDDPELLSSSRELLESILPVRLRPALAALVDDLPAVARLPKGASFHKVEEIDYEQLLKTLAADSGEALATIASYHSCELGLTGAGALPELALGRARCRAVDQKPAATAPPEPVRLRGAA